MKKTDLANKKVTVMGLGLQRGGLGVVKFLLRQKADILITDLKIRRELAPSIKEIEKTLSKIPQKHRSTLRYVLGKHRAEDFKKADLIIKNPGVRPDNKYLKIAAKNKVPVETDMSLFFKLCPAKITAVTGTRGKSTTATLIHALAKKKKRSAVLGGNIRISPLDYLSKIKKDTPVILELSSWQLNGLKKPKLSPHIGIFTNIMRDHLNVYSRMSDYINDKKIIYKYQQPNDFIILNLDNAATKKLGKEVPSQRYWFSKQYFAEENGTFARTGHIYFRAQGKCSPIIAIEDLKLIGEHNLENVLAAITAAKIMKVSNKDIKSVLKKFKGIPDRLELIRNYQGIKFYNDTTASTPDATKAALNSFPKKVILIAGGTDKELHYQELASLIPKKVKHLVLLKGSGTKKLVKVLPDTVEYGEFSNLKAAVNYAMRLAYKGDVILFSPAGTSFELFANEFERGERFKSIVKGLR